MVVPSIAGMGVWFGKKEIFQKLNGYREIKFCEDYDFLLRAYQNGFRLGMCDKVVLYYRINELGITRSNSLRQFLSANYLKENLERLENITQEEINSKIAVINDKDAEKFEKSISCFRTGVNSVKSKKYITGATGFLKGIASSKYALNNLQYIIKSHCAMRG